MYLVTGAGGGIGSVSRAVVELLLDDGQQVRAMVRRDDDRADALRELGAEVVVGDLTNPQDVADAMAGVDRMFFNMSVSPDYLTATSIVCAVAREAAPVEVIVNMSQMTVSQMTLTSTSESHQHRLHWLAEHIINWSGVPVVHVRPTVFMENPLFTMLAAGSIRERGAAGAAVRQRTDVAGRRRRCRPRGGGGAARPRGPHRRGLRADRAGSRSISTASQSSTPARSAGR